MSDCILYGIPNCDRVRAARKWLEQKGVPFRFHDLRQDGVDETLLRQWLEQVDLTDLVNRRSATWRQLNETTRQHILNGDLSLLAQYPTLIRRPVLACSSTLTVGFNPDHWETLLS